MSHFSFFFNFFWGLWYPGYIFCFSALLLKYYEEILLLMTDVSPSLQPLGLYRSSNDVLLQILLHGDRDSPDDLNGGILVLRSV